MLSILYGRSDRSLINKLHKKAYDLLHSDHEAAMLIVESSLLLSKEVHLKWSEAEALFIKGIIFANKNNVDKAVQNYLSSALIFNGSTDKNYSRVHSSVFLNAGNIFKKYHMYEESVELLNLGIKIAETWGLEDQWLKLMISKATALYSQRKLDESLEVLDKVKLMLDVQIDGNSLIKCWNIYGLINKEIGAFVTAKNFFETIAQSKYSSQKDVALAFHNLGLVYQKESYIDTARMSFESALKKAQEIEDANVMFISAHALALLHKNAGDLNLARSYAKRAEKKYHKIERFPNQFELFNLLHLIHTEMRQKVIATDYLIRYHDESSHFDHLVQKIMRTNDEYHMDLLVQEYQRESAQKQEKASFYRRFTLKGLMMIMLILVSCKVKVRWGKEDLSIRIFRLMGKTRKND